METYRYPIPCEEVEGVDNGKVSEFELTERNQFKQTVFKNPITVILWICRILLTRISKNIGHFLPRSISYNLMSMLTWVNGSPSPYGRKRKWQPNAVSQFQFFSDGRNTYEKCFVSDFSENDWVKWGLENKIGGCIWVYIGKIEFIGNPMGKAGPDSTIAVVIFDQDTSQLPGFISHTSGNFANIINITELENLTAPEIAQTRNGLHSNVTGVDHLKNKFARLSISDLASNSSKNVVKLKEPINIDSFRAKLSLSKEQWFGIQGNENSCYVDACLFSLFAFNQALDSCIPIKTETVNDTSHFLKTILRDIINHLRSDYLVGFAETRKLRHILSQKYDKRFQKAFMDAEDFLLTLFEGINIPSMFEYDNGYSDHVHQIILPPNWDLSQKVESMTVHDLVKNSFIASGVKLKQPPDGLFIIKLPVSNGELIPCKYIIPNLQLDFSTILSQEIADEQPAACASLSAVICFRNSHYVSYSRANDKEHSPWVFMDSNSLTGTPKVVVLDYLDSILKGLLSQPNEFKNYEDVPNIEKQYANRLLTDAYICVYDTKKSNILD